MAHLDGEVLTVQRLHLMKSISLELLGLDPHCHLQHPEGRAGGGGESSLTSDKRPSA